MSLISPHPWIVENYACATCSSLPRNRFYTETSGCSSFTLYCCEISYRNESFALVQQPGLTRAGMTCSGTTFSSDIM